jgi:RHS repeat-associated protein
MSRLLAGVVFALLLSATAAHAQDEVIYYHTDAIGSVRMTTDASGAVVARYDFLPFGEPWDTVPPNPSPDARQFTGKERDVETGLDYFGARYMRAQSGRFISIDPVLTVDAALVNPQRWNRYAYSLNNPFRFVDPDGRQIKDLMTFMATHEKELVKVAQTAMTVKNISDVVGVLSDFLSGGGVSAKIDANLNSGDYSAQVEGLVGVVVQQKFGSELIDVNRKLYRDDGSQLTEADLVLSFATVEVKSGKNVVNLTQTRNLQQALGQPVIVYAPEATPSQIREIQGVGATVVKNSSALLRALLEIRQ